MTGNNDQFDKNVRRLLDSALSPPRPEFQRRLVRDVLAEVACERSRQEPESVWKSWITNRRAWRPLPLAAATAAVILLALAGWHWLAPANSAIARVSCLYGLVAIQDHGAPRTVYEAGVDIESGQRVVTHTGSKAQIILADRSRLVPEPRTRLQVQRTGTGPTVVLEEGAVSIEATKQSAGKAITVKASGTVVKILGTKLDVRVVEKPSGAHQTRVRVLSGKVEMESGGEKVLLVPGTEGVADQDRAPVRSSVVFEVNELIRLQARSDELARNSSKEYGRPAIVDLTTDTIWTVVPVRDLQATGEGGGTLKLKYAAFGARAYHLDGSEIPTQGRGEMLHCLLVPETGQRSEYFILKVPGVGGLLRASGEAQCECSFVGSESDSLRLVQFHLPEAARLEAVSPAASATRIERNRQIVTLAARVRLPQLYE